MISEKKGPLRIKNFVIGSLATNCYLIYDEVSKKGFLIDPAVYDTAIVEYIEANEIEVEAIINTHGHADHIMGDAAFGFPVLIHEFDAPCLNDPLRSLSFLSGQKAAPPRVKNHIRDGEIIEMGNIALEVIHTPGHSPGGISIKCEDVLFSGDTLFLKAWGVQIFPEGITGHSSAVSKKS